MKTQLGGSVNPKQHEPDELIATRWTRKTAAAQVAREMGIIDIAQAELLCNDALREYTASMSKTEQINGGNLQARADHLRELAGGR